MKILICGGRDYSNWTLFVNVLSEYAGFEKAPTLISGGARGAGQMAERYAHDYDLNIKVYRADWNAHGRAAGPRRNQLMLTAEAPDLILAFPGGRGTADMVRRARLQGFKVREISDEK